MNYVGYYNLKHVSLVSSNNIVGVDRPPAKVKLACSLLLCLFYIRVDVLNVIVLLVDM